MDIEFKFFIDELTGKSHAEMHDVSADEIHEFFTLGKIIDAIERELDKRP